MSRLARDGFGSQARTGTGKIQLVQLTTSRIGSLILLICTLLLYVMVIHTYTATASRIGNLTRLIHTLSCYMYDHAYIDTAESPPTQSQVSPQCSFGNGCCLSGITMGQFLCASLFPHPRRQCYCVCNSSRYSRYSMLCDTEIIGGGSEPKRINSLFLDRPKIRPDGSSVDGGEFPCNREMES